MFTTRKIITSGNNKLEDNHSIYFDGDQDAMFSAMNSNTWTCSSTSVGADVSADWNTISCWFYLDKTGGVQRIWNMGSSNPGIFIQTAGSDVGLFYNTGASEKLGFDFPNGSWNDVLNSWNHITVSVQMTSHYNGTHDDVSLQGSTYVRELSDSKSDAMLPLMWFNGVQQTVTYHDSYRSQRTNDLGNGGQLFIASNSGDESNNSQPFKGYISDIACYKTKFTDAMAKAVYNNREPFDHNDWSVGKNYCTYWNRMGDSPGDVKPFYYDNMKDVFDDTSDASNYGKCYSSSANVWNFNGNSAASALSDDTDITSHANFTAVNCTATMQSSNSDTGLEIKNTTTSNGELRFSGTIESGVKYKLQVFCTQATKAWVTHGCGIKMGTSAGGSQYGSKNISSSNSGSTFEFTSTGTTIHGTFYINSTTANDKCRLKKFTFEKMEESAIQDASLFNNTETTSNGEPKVTNNVPW